MLCVYMSVFLYVNEFVCVCVLVNQNVCVCNRLRVCGWSNVFVYLLFVCICMFVQIVYACRVCFD